MAHRPRPTAPPRKTPKPRVANPGADKLRELYDSGMDQEQIAAHLGAARSSVQRWMQKDGIETRKGRNAQKAVVAAAVEPQPEHRSAGSEELGDIETIDVDVDGVAVVMVSRLNKRQWVKAHRWLLLQRAPKYRQMQEFEAHEEKEFL